MPLQEQVTQLLNVIVLLIAVVGMLVGYIMATPPRSLPRWLHMDDDPQPACPLHRCDPRSCVQYHKDEE